MRAELAAQGTQVLAVFPSSTDTPMVAGFDGEKQPPEAVAEGICDALEEGVEDVCIGAHSIQTEALMRSDPKAAEREFAALLPGAARHTRLERDTRPANAPDHGVGAQRAPPTPFSRHAAQE